MRGSKFFSVFMVGFVSTLLSGGVGRATYSIVATDLRNGQLGGIVTSCIAHHEIIAPYAGVDCAYSPGASPEDYAGCTPNAFSFRLFDIFAIAPGKGILASQAGTVLLKHHDFETGLWTADAFGFPKALYPELAVPLLDSGMVPQDILDELSVMGSSAHPSCIDSPETGPVNCWPSGQYGAVTIEPSANGFYTGHQASFSGTGANPYACDETIPGCENLSAQMGPYLYSVQGNLMSHAATLANTATEFVYGEGCDLADRLMRSLEAGAEEFQGVQLGDNRCTGKGIAGNAAYLIVANADGSTAVELSASLTDDTWLQGIDPNTLTEEEQDATEYRNAVAELRVKYDAWRVDNACPAEPWAADDTTTPEDSWPDRPIGYRPAPPVCAASPAHGGEPRSWLLAIPALLLIRRRK